MKAEIDAFHFLTQNKTSWQHFDLIVSFQKVDVMHMKYNVEGGRYGVRQDSKMGKVAWSLGLSCFGNSEREVRRKIIIWALNV